MKKKTNIEKKIRSFIKQEKLERTESQRRVFEFNDELVELIKRETSLFDELKRVQMSLEKKRHLIQMYDVMDGRRLMILWRLEVALGNKDSYPEWKQKFIASKEGFEFKKRRP